MPTRSAKFYSIALILGDFFVLLLAFTLAYILRVQMDPRPLVNEVYALDFIQTFTSIAPLWLLVFASLGLYTSTVYSRRLVEWTKLLIGSFIGILIVLGYAFVIDEPVFPARLVAVYAFIGSFLLLVFEREILRLIRTLLFRFGIGISRVLIIGNSQATRDIASQMSDTPRSGYDVVAVAGPDQVLPKNASLKHYETVEAALESLKTDRITTIIQTDLYETAQRNLMIMNAAQCSHINYTFIPGEPEFYSGKNTVDVFLGYPVIAV
ncbi:sugar transferase, partial [Candidatus Saccharibacteria bacterium]